MCGSAEGPTPEQLAHPPLKAFDAFVNRLMVEAEVSGLLQSAVLFDRLERVRPEPQGKFIVWPVKDARADSGYSRIEVEKRM